MFGVYGMVCSIDGSFYFAYHGVNPNKLFTGDTLRATTEWSHRAVVTAETG